MADHTSADWRATIRVLPQKALVVAGGKSDIFPVEGCTWVATAAPAGTAYSVVFARCGHWLYVEASREFVDVVCDWVEGKDVPAVVE